jgi:excisionase family DNA binding protein
MASRDIPERGCFAVPEINPAVDCRYATIGEAAAHIKVNERTIRDWMRAGKLASYRFSSRTIRIDLAELDALGGAR